MKIPVVHKTDNASPFTFYTGPISLFSTKATRSRVRANIIKSDRGTIGYAPKRSVIVEVASDNVYNMVDVNPVDLPDLSWSERAPSVSFIVVPEVVDKAPSFIP
jgi:hypothetical protein